MTRKEIEQLRPWITSQVRSILGFSEDTVVNAAIDCLAKSLSRSVATELLSTFLDDSTEKFTKALYEKVQEIKLSKETSGAASSSGKKRNARDAFGDEDDSSHSSKKHHSKDKEKGKKQKMIELIEKAESDGVELPPTATDQMSQEQIQSMLAQTMKQIETRKKQVQETPPPPPAPAPAVIPQPVVIPAAAMRLYNNVDPALINETIEKAKRAAELQARIKNQLSTKPALLSTIGTGQPLATKPTPLILDSEGRTVDAAGRTIQLSQRQPTLKANIRAQKRAQFKQIVQEKPKEKVVGESPYFDHRMGTSAALAPQRGKKMFKFHEPGKFQRLAQTMRAKAQLERLQGEIASTARKTGISSATKLALIAPSKEVYEDRVPDVEWWDAAILPTGR